MVDQRRESPLGRIHVKSRSHSDAEIVADAPNQPRMDRKAGVPRRVLDSRNQFKVVCHAAFAFESNPKRKADGKVIRDVRGLACGARDQREHKTNMPAYSGLSFRCRYMKSQQNRRTNPK